MTEAEYTPQLIGERQTGTGLVVKFFDHSKKLTGDRWQVKLVCETEIPVTERFFDSCRRDDDPDLAARIIRQLGEKQVHVITRERNFVEAAAREGVVTELVEQLDKNILEYLAGQSFTKKFLCRRYEEEKKRLCLQMQQAAGPPPTDDDDDDGPADFSALFRDAT